MVSSQHTQSLTQFRQKASETIERINRTGKAEILTVNGEARAVLVPPAVFDAMTRKSMLAYDVAAIRRSMREFEEGKGRSAEEFFDEVRTKLLAMKAAQEKKD